MSKISDNLSDDFYNIPENDKMDKNQFIYEDIDDFIFDDEKTVPSER